MDYETYEPLATWFESTWVGDQMRNIFWLFPMMETIHFIGLTIMFGSLLVIDVRVIGFGRFINIDEIYSNCHWSFFNKPDYGPGLFVR